MRDALRAQLGRNAERCGLSTSAIEALVERARVTQWDRGQRIVAAEDAQNVTNFLVSGVVKVTCRGGRGVPVTVQFIKPGQLFGLTWPFEGAQPRRFAAVAHVASTVAMVSREAMTEVVATLPPDRLLRLMASTWRALSRLLYDKCLLLSMPLRERLLYELGVLARDFGRPEGTGVRIDLVLTHTDLAQLVAGSRANVTRAVAQLRRAGLLTVVDRQFALVARDVPQRAAL